MKKLFSPGISLINHLNYPQKLLLIGFIIMLPITVIMYLKVINEGYELFYILNNKLDQSIQFYLHNLLILKAVFTLLILLFLVTMVYFFIHFYLSMKSTVNHLVTASNMVIQIRQLIQQCKDVHSQLRNVVEEKSNLAFYDTLTGLPNRNFLFDYFETKVAPDNYPLTVFFLDLDRFKIINDAMGHSFGDQLLKATAQRLKECTASETIVARFGGDEFIILLESGEQSEAEKLAKHIIDEFSRPFVINDSEVFISPSIGISFYRKDGDSIDNLIKNADTAMYRAKEKRNTYQFFKPEMKEVFAGKMELEKDLRYALEREEFQLHYQPQIELKSGRIRGVEALIRWRHPRHGMLSPDHFIPFAEETGLIIPLGEWVIQKVCQQMQTLNDAGYPPLRISINISMAQFFDRNLIRLLQEQIKKHRIRPTDLTLEITENIAFTQQEYLVSRLMELKKLGIKLALDDFGTGYSSLNQLKEFPIDILKIDKTFIDNLGKDSKSESIVEAIIKVAHDFHLSIIAEGVENMEQLIMLKQKGCDEVQGYYFSKPLSLNELEKTFWQIQEEQNEEYLS